MTLSYLSVCSGIEAATQAWRSLGWQPVAYSEIDKFPSAVLAHHYSGVPNWGDMSRFQEWPDADVDVLCGGTPCQSFSIAGLRKGLDDPRGNLMLTFGAIAARYRPDWLLWENVPGVLSSDGGRDFASFLGLLTGRTIKVPDGRWQNSGIVPGIADAYGIAWRVLDAQYVRTCSKPMAVPQRRRRVFVVGYLGDWRRAAAVLFDRESLRRDPPPRREQGQGLAASVAPSLTSSGRGVERPGETRGQDQVIAVCADVTTSLDASMGRLRGASGQDANHGHSTLVAFGGNRQSGPIEAATAVNANGGPAGRLDFESETFVVQQVAPTLRGEGFDASEDGTGRGTPIIPIAFNSREDPEVTGDRAGPLGAQLPQAQAVVWSIMPQNSGRDYKARQADVAQPLMAGGLAGGNQGGDFIQPSAWAVRRLMPVECERLQGMDDGFTDVPWRGKPGSPDGRRYKALGNSWALNCVEWIGERIAEVDSWET